MASLTPMEGATLKVKTMMLLSLILSCFALATMAASNVLRVPVLRNPKYNANGTKSMVWLYHKYRITPHGSSRFHRTYDGALMKKEADGSSTSVTSNDQQNDTFYTIPISIGTPGQKLLMNLDTGSADFWVWSTRLSSKIVQQAHAAGVVLYDAARSSTQKPLDQSTWSIRYGDGSSASGTVVMDTVRVGNIGIQNQAVECADTLSAALASELACQGIMGMSFGSINTVKPVKQKTPLDNMIAQQDIAPDQELFTCYLGSYKDVNDPDHGQSFYTFGKIDDEAVKTTGGQITYTPVNNTKGFWAFASEFISINGQKTALTNNSAIADTGTTLMMIDDALVEQIYSTIPGAKYDNQEAGWVFPANTSAADMPTVGIAVGETEIIIEKEHLGFAPTKDAAFIFGGIQGRGDFPTNIYGDTFLKCVYAVFDAGNQQFGVVQRFDPTQDIAG